MDTLIDKLGGVTQVAELTGRKKRLVRSQETGKFEYQSRSANGEGLKSQNIYEKDLFLNGAKRIAIISEAASSGISLLADC